MFGRIYQDLWYWLYRRGYGVIRINEKEDFPVFSEGEINPDIPQKLGSWISASFTSGVTSPSLA